LHTVILILILFPFFSIDGAAQTTWYVPDDFTTIQGAIADPGVLNGDTIIVKPGTYIENIDFLGKDIALVSQMGLKKTIIDGHKSGSVVSFVNGEGKGAMIKGFTLTNGSGTLYNYDLCGGGVFCLGSSPKIVNNLITNNEAKDGYGGGIECLQGSCPEIFDNVISYNSAGDTYGNGGGGGIDCFMNSFPHIEKNLINNNNAYGDGGGLYCLSTATVVDNVIFENYSSDLGGGIYSGGDAESLITNNKIYQNLAGGGGGITAGNDTVIDNFIYDNNATSGGGIHCSYKSSPVIVNNMILGNDATDLGGGVSCSLGATPVITNNTIYDNSADKGGGVYSWVDDSFHIYNTILWGNTANFGFQIYLDTTSTLFINSSDVMGGQSGVVVGPQATLHWGSGMIDADPLFANVSESDLHILFISPCRNKGDNSALNIPVFDFEGNDRIVDAVVDIGADEFDRRLYFTGDTNPGGILNIMFVGTPGSSPVLLWVGSGLLDPPISTKYGDWCLQFPLLIEISLGSIPIPDGILALRCPLPLNLPVPLTLILQSVVGSSLTNYCEIELE